MIYGTGKVGRTVTISHCNGQAINKDRGDPEFVDFDFSVYGMYTPERATRYARRAFKDNSIIIFNVEHETGYYQMPLEEFMQTAVRS